MAGVCLECVRECVVIDDWDNLGFLHQYLYHSIFYLKSKCPVKNNQSAC